MTDNAPKHAPETTQPFQNEITLAGGVRLAWGCSIHDAVQAAAMAEGIPENKAREIAYKATGDARDRFENTPANAELNKYSETIANGPDVLRERDELRAQLGDRASLVVARNDEIDSLRADNARLKEALLPFTCPPGGKGYCTISCTPGWTEFANGHIDKARAALAGTEAGEE